MLKFQITDISKIKTKIHNIRLGTKIMIIRRHAILGPNVWIVYQLDTALKKNVFFMYTKICIVNILLDKNYVIHLNLKF